MADKVASSSSSTEKCKDSCESVNEPVPSTSRECSDCTSKTSAAVDSALGKRSAENDALKSKSSDEPAKKKKYRQKFKASYSKDYPCIGPSQVDNEHARCETCVLQPVNNVHIV